MIENERMLEGKKVVMGVTGSIAAIKAIELARELRRQGAEVHAVMSDAASEIVHPTAIEFATGNRVIMRVTGMVEHVSFFSEGRSDLFLVAPATANTISKMALGIADTPVAVFAATVLGTGLPVVISPAMHEVMYLNPAIRKHMDWLKGVGVSFVEPRIEENAAKMADIEDIMSAVIRGLSEGKTRNGT